MSIFSTTFKAAAVAATVTFAAGTSAQASTLLTNGGFETGDLTGWTIEGGAPIVTSDEANTGDFSVSALSLDRIRQDFTATATSLIDEVSIWVRRDGGAFNSYTFFYDDNSTESFLIDNLPGPSDWIQYDLTSNLAAGRNLSGFAIFGTSPGPAFFDDVFIGADMATVPLPAGLPLMLVGLGAFGLIRRRTAS